MLVLILEQFYFIILLFRTISIVSFIMTILMVIIFILSIFLECNVGPLAGATKSGRILQPYCSHQYICSTTTFAPVCPENSTLTYLSSCFAGCSNNTKLDNVKVIKLTTHYKTHYLKAIILILY